MVPVLTATWAYSNYPFVLALPFERTEAILAGTVAAFEFFGRVPKEVWWDYVAGHIIPLMCPTALCGREAPGGPVSRVDCGLLAT
jgi:hypothetical protein